MKPKFILLVATMLIMGYNVFGQFNDYKYIIVPKKFDAFRQANMHQTSTVIKFYLAQKGFNTIYDDNLPEDLFRDRCLGLTVDFLDDSSFIATKGTIVFKDCRSVEVFRTVEGKSKLKDFRPAYNEVIKEAFVSLDGIEYTYEPKDGTKASSNEGTVTLNFKNDVHNLSEESKEVILEEEATPENQTYKVIKPKPALNADTSGQKVDSDKAKKMVLEQRATTENQTYKAIKPKSAISDGSVQSDLLYAQPTANGYQLIDISPKIRYKLVETSAKNIYLVSEGDQMGVVFQIDGRWKLEYIENGIKRVKELDIKF